MEESLNPTVNIGPISFDLTLLAMSLVTVLMVFAFVEGTFFVTLVMAFIIK